MGWMQSKGLKTDIEIIDIPDMGKGLKSNRQFTQNEIFLTIPKTLIITIDTVKKEIPGDYDQITEIQSLVVFLAAMKCHKLSSEWNDYMNFLPTEISLPLDMDKELLSFSSTHLRNHVEKQQKTCKEDCKAVESFFNLDAQAVKWAWLAVNTRCITLRAQSQGYPTIALMPFLDFLNHSSSISIKSHYDQVLGDFRISTNRNISPGDQAFLCYGPHDNTFLLCEYGFVEENNNYDYVRK